MDIASRAQIQIGNEVRSQAWPLLLSRIFSFLLPLLVVLIIFDRRTDEWCQRTVWIIVGLAALFDRKHISRARVSAFLILLVFPLLLSVVTAFGVGKGSSIWIPALKYQVVLLWAAVAWLYSHYLNPTHLDTRSHSQRLLACTLLTPAVLFSAWATVSAAASFDPKMSFKLLGAELLPYVGMLLFLPRFYPDDGFYRATNRGWWIIVIAIIGMALVAAGQLLGPGVIRWMYLNQLYRHDEDALMTLRLQYLFQHHNRAGIFAACALFIALAGKKGTRLRRVACVTAVISAAIALPYTTTRGAVVAAMCGILVLIAGYLLSGRARYAVLALLIGVPVAGMLTPVRYKSHFARLFSPAQYQGSQGGSISARILIWQTTSQMIGKRPWLGFGYGFENFEPSAQREHPGQIGYFRGAVHAHNTWLETAAETGIPGAMLLLTFTVMRMGALGIAWWKTRHSKSPMAALLLIWLALEVTIQIYGMTNYTLRRGLGLFIYGIWGGSIVLILHAMHSHDGEAMPPSSKQLNPKST